jgi:spermidine/putrescine transport system substrate-binding protein
MPRQVPGARRVEEVEVAPRRFTLVLAGVLALALVAVACGGDGEETATPSGDGTTVAPEDIHGTIRLLSYGDGFDPKYLADFYETYPNIKLESSAMSSNEEAVAKIQAGFEVDMVNACVDEAALEMVQKGIYAPLDVSRLVYWDDLFPSMRELPGVQVDGEIYMLPVDAGTAGIVYDADVVTPAPDSWTDLFDPRWSGRMAIEDIAVTGIMIGALANGITDPLHMSDADLEMVTNYLIDHKDQIRTFWKGDASIKALYKSGEIVISSGYPDNAKSLQKEGLNTEFVVAKEGQFLWACGYGITPDIAPENLDAAYALLNYYTSPEAELFEATEWNYQVANQTVLDIAPPEVIEAASLDAPMGMENAIPASPPENRAAWVAAWTEVKAS